MLISISTWEEILRSRKDVQLFFYKKKKVVNECFLDLYPVMTAPEHRRGSLCISQQPQTSVRRKAKLML